YNQPADLLLEVGKHTSVVLRCGLPCLDDDLFSGSSGLPGFLFQQAISRSAGFLDELRRLGVSLHHHFLTLSLRSRQLRFHLVGMGGAGGDGVTRIPKLWEERFIGKPREKKKEDRKADHLSYQRRPPHTESPGNLFDLTATLCLRHQDKCIHKPVLPYKEQGV